ncbi:MAG: type II toxin-antitoxin system PemK/MazF family toxin [Bacteroidota bacterium]
MSWNDLKAVVREKQSEKSCKPRQIWWTFWGENIGQEQNGKGVQYLRPVIIIKRYNYGLCFVAPLTTKIIFSKEYFTFRFSDKNDQIQSRVAMLNQVRVISTKRLISKMGYVTEIDMFKGLIEKLSLLLFG